jgi:hypothetical protein
MRQLDRTHYALAWLEVTRVYTSPWAPARPARPALRAEEAAEAEEAEEENKIESPQIPRWSRIKKVRNAAGTEKSRKRSLLPGLHTETRTDECRSLGTRGHHS